ncbi:hypothetical protein J4429_06015 [Candidatus Pacearchaeota archaeon]|nr:hypothetical protein [Candidatus Pacearchaeota archaeon]
MKFFKKTGEKFKLKNIITIIVILVIIIIVFSFLGYNLFYSKSCKDEACFDSAINVCKKASWLKEDSESAWMLRILGKETEDYCKLNIKLLNIKKGTIDSEKLIGKEMICIVTRTEKIFPSADMSQCTGPLKEEMQDLIIKRMHDYLLKNLGEIKEEFKAV